VIGDRTYAFVGLERVGGYMVYDVTDPANASFVSYKPQTGDDRGPETSVFVAAADSPTGEALLISSQEISNTVTFYSVQRQSDGDDVINGAGDADRFNGRAGNDTINGKGGDDVLIGGAGADIIIGGTGFDTASYETATAGVIVNLSTGRGSGGDADGDMLSEIEAVLGSGSADTITGSRAADTLNGAAGNDVLLGARGADILIGGAGNDVMTGGLDADIFRFDAIDNGSIDFITDFQRGEGDALLFGTGVTVTAASVGFLTTGATANGVDLRNGAGSLDLVLTLETAGGSQTVHVLDAYNFASNDYWEGVLGLELTYPRPLPVGTDLLPIA
jgi:Ca2+-binding RTX toxin-like protein